MRTSIEKERQVAGKSFSDTSLTYEITLVENSNWNVVRRARRDPGVESGEEHQTEVVQKKRIYLVRG